MKKVLIVKLMFLAFLISFGEEIKVAILPNWEKNETIKYKYVVTRTTYENDKIKNKIVSTGKIKTKLIDIEDEEAVFELNYYEMETDNPQMKTPEMKKYMDDAEKLTVVYRTGENGQFVCIENIEEIQKLLGDTIEEVAKIMPQDSKTEQFKNIMKKTMLDENNIENTYTDEIKNINNLYGWELEYGKIIENEYQIPNLFGGNPYPSKYTIKLNQIDDKKKECEGEIIITPDNEKFIDITYQTLKQITGKEFDKSLLGKMKINIKMNFIYDMGKNRVKELKIFKEVVSLKNKQTDERIIEYID